jgi:hypothetical protein
MMVRQEIGLTVHAAGGALRRQRAAEGRIR